MKEDALRCLLASVKSAQQGLSSIKGIEEDLKWMRHPDCHIVSKADDCYPPLLKEIPNPPLLLFVQGNLALLKKPAIAIVGSRRPSSVGGRTAFAFAEALSKQGLVVASGLAEGIDGAAHQGALLQAGRTLAVLGHGLDDRYPKMHQRLASKIVAEGGALLSEFPLGTPPIAAHFPRRNRLISGLSMGTLVIEAALKSGSLITARLAAEQGREVFAVPGSIYSQTSEGCHALIREGAKLVEKAEDVLEELQMALKLFV